MYQHLQDLLNTNDPPSDDTLQQIQDILSEPRKQLEEVKAEIQRLEEIRARLDATIQHYDPILAPIRRIPPDILTTIFMHCLPNDRNPDMRASECPMLLTRVCSAWRSVALSFPRLWAKIHILYLHLSTIPPWLSIDEDDSFDERIQDHIDFGSGPAPTSQVIENLRRRWEGVHVWLTRSGECPSIVSISYETEFVCNRQTYGWSMESSTSAYMITAIIPFASRFKELELQVAANVYSIIETALSSCTLTNLEMLKVSLHNRDVMNDSLSLSRNLFKYTPNLRCISMTTFPYHKFHSIPLGPRSGTSWRNITSLSIFVGCTQRQTMILLELCQNLHRAHFRIVDNVTSSFTLFSNNVILPNLEYFWIIEEVISVRHGDNMVYNGLYKYIHAPRLQYLKCQGYHEFEPSAVSLELLLKRSTQLEKFSLGRAPFSPVGIRTVIRTISAGFLTNLVLHSNYQREYFEHGANGTNWEEEMDPFDLSWLIVDHNPGSSNSADLFLPHLEEFVLYDTFASDTTVLKFITSRLNPHSHVAVLKSVVIYFNRAKAPNEIDIQEQAEAHAMDAGISLQLYLEYLPPIVHLSNAFRFPPPAVHTPLVEPFGSFQDDFFQEYSSDC